MFFRHRVLSIVMLSTFAALAGCGGSTETAPADESDTGTTDDTGSSTEDTGTPADDTGTPADDTSTPADDTGAPADDTGAPADDTGTPPTDSGTAGDTAVATDTGTAADTAPPVDAGPVATCTSTAIATFTDKHVRQGAGAVTITVTGTSLATVTGGTIGAITCTASGATATSVTLSCTIPHGATLGAQNLVLTGVTATCAAAITIDKITSATTGDDTAGLGTATKPFKSVKKSLSVSGAGDTVFVTAGNYGTATGDTWTNVGTATSPLGAMVAKTVPADVTIEGDPTAAPTLTGADALLGLRFSGNATVKNVKLDNFRFAIAADAGTLTLTDVTVSDSVREGIFAEGTANLVLGAATAGTTATPSKCLLTNNNVGLHLYAGAKASLTNCDVTLNNSAGLDVRQTTAGSPDLTATTSRILSNGDTGPGLAVYGGNYRVGAYVEGGAKVTLSGGELSSAFDYGLLAYGTTVAAPTLSFTNTDFNANGTGAGSAANSGLRLDTAATVPSFGSLKFTGGKIDKSGFYGISTGGAFNTELSGVSVTASGNSGLALGGTGTHVLSNVTATGNTQSGLSFGGSGSISSKGLVATGNGTAAMSTAAQILITDGANLATKIEFLAGTAPNTTSRTTASATVPLFRDGRGAAAGGGAAIQIAATSLFQGATLKTGTYTAMTGATPLNVVVPGGTQLALQIATAGRTIQVL